MKELKLQVDSGISSGKIVKEVTDLGKSIDGKLIIRDLDLIIQRGDRIGLVGPNGCGKSTLLNCCWENFHRTLVILKRAPNYRSPTSIRFANNLIKKEVSMTTLPRAVTILL